MSHWLYRTEAKSIQSYVLDTGRLVEIAGASSLVEELGDRVDELLSELDLDDHVQWLSRAAGAATLRFADRAALKAFAELWPLVADRHAPGLEVVQAWVSEREQPDPFRDLGRELRRARSVRWPDLPEAGPFTLRAGRTGRPAVGRDPRKGGLVDRATRARNARYHSGSDALARKLLGDEADNIGFITEHSELGEGYVAVIHIDGNDMGRLFQARSQEHYRALSDAVSECTIEAARIGVRAVRSKLGTDERSSERDPAGGRPPRRLPLRPVVIGGDDITLITRARDALVFTLNFLRAFESDSRQHLQRLGLDREGLTASAGIAVVKAAAPFRDGHDLAVELCDVAKSRLRGAHGGATPSAVMFHRVTTSLGASWDQVEATELAARASDPASLQPGALCMGPYLASPHAPVDAPAIEPLQELARVMTRLPRGSFREWLALAPHSAHKADARWARIREVLKTTDRIAFKALETRLEALGVDPHTGWTSAEPRRTPILDATTLRVMGALEISTGAGT